MMGASCVGGEVSTAYEQARITYDPILTSPLSSCVTLRVGYVMLLPSNTLLSSGQPVIVCSLLGLSQGTPNGPCCNSAFLLEPRMDERLLGSKPACGIPLEELAQQVVALRRVRAGMIPRW